MNDHFLKSKSQYIFGLVFLLTSTLSGCLLTPVQQGEMAKVIVNDAKEIIETNETNETTPLKDETAADQSPMPNPDYSPDEVVAIQLAALKNNDRTDDGIAIVFRFASPANKKSTGPLRRFTAIVKNPHYRPLLNHLRASPDPVKIDGYEAVQRVTLVDEIGNEIIYLFFLSKQRQAPCAGCWLTDGVIIEAVKPGQTA